MRVPAKVESALGIRSAIEHHPFDVRVSGVAGELPNLRSTGPRLRGDVRAFELTCWVLWKRQPEACGLGTCGYIPAVDVVRVRDPEGGRRVVGRNQLVGGRLTLRSPSVDADD